MLEISKANESNIADICRLEQLCFTSPIPPAVIYEDICNSRHPYLVAKIEGEVIGYCGMYIVLDEAYVLNICIHPDYRGKGYGKLILKALMLEAVKLGAYSMTLEVRVSNAIAIELYKDAGFEVAGRRKKYYEDTGEDAYIMWKQGL